MDDAEQGRVLLGGHGGPASSLAERGGGARTLRSARTQWFRQFTALCRKNWQMHRRSRRQLLLFMLLPALSVGVIAFTKATAYRVSGGEGKHVDLSLRRCRRFDVYGQQSAVGASAGGGTGTSRSDLSTGGQGQSAASCITLAFARARCGLSSRPAL